MTTTDTLDAALLVVQSGLRSFVENEMRRVHGDRWENVARATLPNPDAGRELNLATLLTIMQTHWHGVFRTRLSQVDRLNAAALGDVGNRTADRGTLSTAERERALDTAQRVLRAIAADKELAELDQVRGILRPGVSRVPVPPKPVASAKSGRAKASVWSAEADALIGEFASRFGPTHRRFGSASLGIAGTSDAAKGVQWNAWMELDSGRAWMSVNLEGMQYVGWPIARLLERELEAPQLPEVASAVQEPGKVSLCLWRDCWQAASRVKILEQAIGDSPIALDALTRERWLSAAAEAQSCLDPAKHHRGRMKQVVTLASSHRREEKDVSPHLQFRMELARPRAGAGWGASLDAGASLLAGLHEFTARRSAA